MFPKSSSREVYLPHHTYIMYCGIFPASRLSELNFLASRVRVEVRAFRVSVEYLLKNEVLLKMGES